MTTYGYCKAHPAAGEFGAAYGVTVTPHLMAGTRVFFFVASRGHALAAIRKMKKIDAAVLGGTHDPVAMPGYVAVPGW